MKNDDSDLKEIFQRVDSEGVASVKVNDGHVFIITLDKLRELLAIGEQAGRDKIVIFVQDPKSLN
jgi:hypothetical protein